MARAVIDYKAFFSFYFQNGSDPELTLRHFRLSTKPYPGSAFAEARRNHRKEYDDCLLDYMSSAPFSPVSILGLYWNLYNTSSNDSVRLRALDSIMSFYEKSNGLPDLSGVSHQSQTIRIEMVDPSHNPDS